MLAVAKLAQTPGILAACYGETGAVEVLFPRTTEEPNRKKLSQILGKTVELQELLEKESELKITLQEYTVVMTRDRRGVYLGVVASKGHPVIKSLKRTLRQVSLTL